MDQGTQELLKFLFATMLGSGGLGGILAGRRVWKQRKEDTPGDEAEARAAVAANADDMPNWGQFNEYWRTEVEAAKKEADQKVAEVRAEMHERITELQQQLAEVRREAEEREAADQEHIEQLERQIWEQKPPPPLPRPRWHRKRTR